MLIDKPYLESAKAEALKQIETFRANLHAAMGYVQGLDAMLKRLDEDEAAAEPANSEAANDDDRSCA